MTRATRRYLGIFLGLAAAGYLTVGAFNLVVDPLDVFGMPKIQGFNAVKSDVESHVRLAKALQVRRLKPKTVVVGSSRALLGLDPESAAWPAGSAPVYNLSLYGGYLYEAMRFYQHALAQGSVEKAVIAVDMWMFDRVWTVRPGFDETRFLVDADGKPQQPDDLEAFRVLFSLDLLRASLRTVGRQSKKDALAQRPDGFSAWRDEAAYPVSKGGHRTQFGYMERMFGATAWSPDTAKRWKFGDPADPQPALEYYRRMISDSYKAGVDAAFVIPPAHARIWETIHAAGLWSEWEAWKRRLVAIAAEEASKAGKPPFPVWDFSGYNAVTTEDVPAGARTAMRYYWDGSHFKARVGDMMLARMFGNGTAAPADFGVRLTAASMDAAFAATRAARAAYAATHPDEVREAGRWAK